MDLANIQPARYVVLHDPHLLVVVEQSGRTPPNLRFRVPRDFEAPNWALGEDSWDLIHIQQACGSVQSWAELYQNVFAYSARRLETLRSRANADRGAAISSPALAA